MTRCTHTDFVDCIYLFISTHNVQIVFISTHTIDRADEAAFYGSTSDTDKSYLCCGGGVIHGNIWYKYSL